MNKIEKRSDLYREWARVLDMCEGTKVNSWKCVKWYDKLGTFEPHLLNTSDINTFKFAIAIVENKPVFVGDELYWIHNGGKHKIKSITDDGWLVTDENGVFHFSGASWNPPKPKTFNLNGVELPLPKQERTDFGIKIGAEYFYFYDEYDWLKVVNAITSLLSGR
jgi:hypothetical protein